MSKTDAGFSKLESQLPITHVKQDIYSSNSMQLWYHQLSCYNVSSTRLLLFYPQFLLIALFALMHWIAARHLTPFQPEAELHPLHTNFVIVLVDCLQFTPWTYSYCSEVFRL